MKLQFNLKAIIFFTVIVAIFFAIMRYRSTEISDEDMNLASIKMDGGLWIGQLNVPWLRDMVETYVDADSTGLTQQQYECIRHTCRLPDETLEVAKAYFFEKYQNEIYGSVSQGADYDFHDLTPRVKTPDEAWELLLHISLSFPSDKRIREHAGFALSFECPWDEEHGGSILFDKNGIPQKMGGSSPFF